MKVRDLIARLHTADPAQDVLWHDDSTDDDLPVTVASMVYGQPVILGPESAE